MQEGAHRALGHGTATAWLQYKGNPKGSPAESSTKIPRTAQHHNPHILVTRGTKAIAKKGSQGFFFPKATSAQQNPANVLKKKKKIRWSTYETFILCSIQTPAEAAAPSLLTALLPLPGVGGSSLRENRNYKRCKRPLDEGFGQHQEIPPLLTKQQLKSCREAALQGYPAPFQSPSTPSEGAAGTSTAPGPSQLAGAKNIVK